MVAWINRGLSIIVVHTCRLRSDSDSAFDFVQSGHIKAKTTGYSQLILDDSSRFQPRSHIQPRTVATRCPRSERMLGTDHRSRALSGNSLAGLRAMWTLKPMDISCVVGCCRSVAPVAAYSERCKALWRYRIRSLRNDHEQTWIGPCWKMEKSGPIGQIGW